MSDHTNYMFLGFWRRAVKGRCMYNESPRPITVTMEEEENISKKKQQLTVCCLILLRKSSYTVFLNFQAVGVHWEILKMISAIPFCTSKKQ